MFANAKARYDAVSFQSPDGRVNQSFGSPTGFSHEKPVAIQNFGRLTRLAIENIDTNNFQNIKKQKTNGSEICNIMFLDDFIPSFLP